MPFSRPFNYHATTGDRLVSLQGLPTDVICKTSFIASKVLDFINLHGAELEYIAIGETSTNKGERIFKLEARRINNSPLGVLVGHLPCPNNCVPPEEMGLIGKDNTFKVQDFRDVLAFNDISFLNVHSAIRRDAVDPMPTHVIYAVTHDNGNPIDHEEEGNPVFTSIENRI